MFNLTHNMILPENHLSSIWGKTAKWIAHYYGDFKKNKDPYILVVGLYIDAIQENQFRNHQSYKCTYTYFSSGNLSYRYIQTCEILIYSFINVCDSHKKCLSLRDSLNEFWYIHAI